MAKGVGASVGVVGAVQVNGPIANQPTKMWDPSTGGFWCAVWFVVALIILWILT